MKQLLKCLMALGLLWQCPAAHAQLVFHSVEELFAYADQHNARLLLGQYESNVARLSTQQRRAALLPSVSLNANATDNLTLQPTLVPSVIFNPAAPSDAVTEVVFGKQYVYNANLMAQWDLVDFEKYVDIKLAQVNEAMQRAEINAQKAGLYTEIAAVFTSMVLLQAQISSQAQNLQSAIGIEQAASGKYENGLIPAPVLNLSLAARLRAEQNLAQSKASLAIQHRHLALLLGTSDSIAINFDLVETAPIAAAIPATDDSPAIELATLQTRMAALQLDKAKAASYPTLSAVYQYGTQVASDEWLSFGDSHSLPQQFVGLKMSVPIFTGLRNKHEREKQRQSLASAEFALEAQRDEQAATNERLLLDFQKSKAQAAACEAILELYAANEAHYDHLLEAGLLDLETRLKYHNDYLAQQQLWLQSVGDLLVSQLNIQIQNIKF